MFTRRVPPPVLLTRHYSSSANSRSSGLSKLLRLTKLTVKGSILGGIGYFFYHVLGKEAKIPEVRRPLRFTPKESLELKQLAEIQHFADIPLGRQNAPSAVDISLPDTVVIEEEKHPSLELPPHFNGSQFEVEMKELTTAINEMRDALRHIQRGCEEEAASRMKEHDKKELQLKQIMEKIETLRRHKFSEGLRNQQKWLSQLRIGSDELVVVMAELMQLSMKEIRKLEQYETQFDGLYKDVLKTVQLIALSEACTVFFSNLSLSVKAFLNTTLTTEDDYYRELLNAKYKLQLEVLGDKAEQVQRRRKQNQKRAGIEEAAHQFHFSYLKHEHDKRDFIVKVKLLISLLERAVIEEKSLGSVLVYFRALSKKDALLEAAYQGFVKDDPKVLRGVASCYRLQREIARVAPQAQISQFYSIAQPGFFKMGLVLLWYRYLRSWTPEWSQECTLRLLTRMCDSDSKSEEICKGDKQIERVRYFLNYNKLSEGLEAINSEEIQDRGILQNLSSRLERRVKLEELRGFLMSYTDFLEKTV